jgi:predicted  nucleic acid-binding Zn-ribbon protein
MDQLFNHFSDIPALEKEKKQVLDIFQEIENGILDLSKLGFKIDAAKGVAELNAANKNLEKTQRDLQVAQQKILETEQRLNAEREKMMKLTQSTAASTTQSAKAYKGLSNEMDENIRKQIALSQRLGEVKKSIDKLKEFGAVAASSQKYNDEMERLVGEQVKLKVEIEQTNRFIKNQAREFIAAEGSLDQMRAQLNQMLQAYDGADDAWKASEGGKSALKTINDLTDAIYEQETASKRYQRNVGNYQGSAKIIADAFERASRRVQDLPKDMSKIGPEGRHVRQEFEALQRIVEDPRFLKVSAKYGDAIQETRFFTKTLVDLEQQGLQNTAVYSEVEARLAKLTDTVGDVRQEIKALSSDTRGFDLFASSVGTAASVFQVYATGVELVSGSNKEAQESIRKLMAIQNLANGVRQIATDLTTRGTAANKAYTFVQKQLAIATAVTTTGVQKFNAALKLTIAGAVITGILLLADAMGIFGSETDKATEQIDKLNNEMEENAEQNAGYARRLDREAENQKLQIKLRRGTQDELNKIDEGARDKKIEGLNIELKEIEKFETNELILAKGNRDKVFEVYDKYAKKREVVNEKIKDLEFGYENQILQQKIENMNKEDDERKKNREKAAEDTKRLTEQERRYANDLLIYKLGLMAEEQAAWKNLEAPDAVAVNLRVKAAQEEFAIRKLMIETQRDFELESERTTASQRELIRLKATQAIAELEAKSGNEIAEIFARSRELILEEAKAFQDEFEAQQKAVFQKQQDTNLSFYESLRDQIDTAAAVRRQAAAKAFVNTKEGQQAYNDELIKIEKERQKKQLENDIAYYETQINLMKAAGLSTVALEKAVAEARAKIANDSIEDLIDVNAKREEFIEREKESLKGLREALLNAFDSTIQGAFDARKNKIQEEIDLVNELKDADIKRIMESGDAEETKAARVALVEARAQQDRERLERRQREIDRQKAIFERTFKAFQISTDGIRTVAKLSQELAILKAAAMTNPLLAPLIPFAAAQIPISIATTAANLVALLATPIPKFARGIGSSPAGAAIVGEAGRELGVEPGGKIKLWERPTLTTLVKGTQIFPNKVTEDILAAAAEDRFNFFSNTSSPMYVKPDRTDEVVDQLKQLNKKSRIIIHNQPGIETSAYYLQQMKH